MDAIFFPRNDYDIEVCNHRYGKSMTFTEQTDKLKANCFSQIMTLAESNNMRVGAFCNDFVSQSDDVNDADVRPYIDDGTLWLDVYWRYVGMTNSTVVDEQTYRTQCDAQKQRFLQRWGRLPVAMSYALGNTSYKSYVKQDFLGARNSSVSGDTDYGMVFGDNDYLGSPDYPYTKDRFTNKASTYRFFNSAIDNSYEYAANEMSAIIDAAKINGGWVNNFTHWHEYINEEHPEYINWMDSYFALVGSKNNNDIHYAGYGESVAYLVYRTMITRAVMYSPIQRRNSQLIIRLQVDNELSINTDLLQIPISVKFSTVGTPLAGREITCDNNIISLGGGDYIVEIPYTGRFPYTIIKAE